MTSSLSLKRTFEIARIWARVYQYRSLKLGALAARVSANTDLKRIHRLGREMEDVLRRDPTCAAKYTDYTFWMPFNVARIGRLSLHKVLPLRVLDIGWLLPGRAAISVMELTLRPASSAMWRSASTANCWARSVVMLWFHHYS